MELKVNEKYILTNSEGEALESRKRVLIMMRTPLIFLKYTKQGLAYMQIEGSGNKITVKRKSLIKY